MHKLTIAVFIIFGAILTLGQANACTTIIVGKNASVDHSIIIARNVDAEVGTEVDHVVIHPSQQNAAGVIFHSSDNDFTYPKHATSLRYMAIPKADSHDASFESGGINQYGVAVSSTETVYNSKKVLAIDPYVAKTGINEDSIATVLLSNVRSAKEGIELLGHIITTQGTDEGFGVAIADKDGAWYLETASGHRWVAVRVPDNSYFVAANQVRIQQVNLNDPTHYLGSKDLIKFAIQHHLYDQAKGKPFNFRQAYSRITPHDVTYNYLRLWTLQHKFNPDLKNNFRRGQFQDFLTPAKKISVRDVEAALQNYYQGTKNDPYTKKGHAQIYRPMSVFRTANSHIIQIRPDLPPAIGNVEYVALGETALSFYFPFYQGITEVPKAYTIGNDTADLYSAFWTYRKLQTLAMLNFASYAPIVKTTYKLYDQVLQAKQQRLESDYLKLYKRHPKQAQQLIQTFTDTESQNVLALTRRLTDTLFTKETTAITDAYLFHGA